jgi:hypothetical protein
MSAPSPPLSRTQRELARCVFELRIRQAKGDTFQDLFNAVMQRRYPSFVPMRPYGNVGDRGNDGYVAETGTFFQVYAPKDPSTTVAEAARKAQTDFAKLTAHWAKSHTIKCYRFVFNDEFGGSVVPIEAALAAITKNHKIPATVFLAKDLESEAFQLPLADFERALNYTVPDASEITDANFEAVREVVNFILSTDLGHAPTGGKLIAADFVDKIKFNGLSDDIADVLRVSVRRTVSPRTSEGGCQRFATVAGA